MINTSNLFLSIKDTVESIEKDLKDLNNTGIFFAPELYTTFCIGKDIYKNPTPIFGNTEIKWLREIDLKNGGPSDNYFETKENKVVIELKIRDTKYAYESDIKKLKRLGDEYEKFFCVLLDSIANKPDGRADYVISKYKEELSLVNEFPFRTSYSPYKSPTECHLMLFQIGEVH